MFKIFSVLLLFSVYANAASFDLMDQLDLLFFGAFGMIVIYNLAYYTVIKEKIYADYFLFHIFVFIIMLFYTGVLNEKALEFSIHGVPVGIFLFSTLALISFSKNFLDMSQINKNLELYVKYVQYSLLILFALSVFPITNTINALVNFSIAYIMLISITLLSTSAYLSFIKKDIYARFYLASFIGILISIIIAFLAYLNLINITENMQYVIEICILLEASLFSFAISYKHKETTIYLAQNELLFKELSHRVQNNLQSIISILTLQQNRVNKKEIKDYLQETINRIRSISLIHEKLQNTTKVGKINVGSYFKSMLKPYKKLNTSIKFHLSCDDKITLDLQKLTPLALITNELITNSVKHAFTDVQSPSISISLEKNNQIYQFIYEDNGIGYDDCEKSLGTMLIDSLSKLQLKGEYVIDSDKKFIFTLKFSV